MTRTQRSDNKRIQNWIAWMCVILIMILMHCYKIGSIPYGINVDEMGMGYDAWCLANFGTDRYLNSFPIYLINFSGGQSALYAYLCAPFVYLFGMEAWVFRIPAVLFSFITLIFLVKIVQQIWSNPQINLMAALLYAISPVFTMLFRIGLDCNLMLGVSTVFLYLLLKSSLQGRQKDWLLAGLVGGVLLYTYAISHMILPLFLIFFFAYILYMKKVTFKQVIIFFIPLVILAAPLIIFHAINMFDMNELQIGIFTIPKLYRYRSDDLVIEDIWKNSVLFFKNTLTFDNLRFDSVEGYCSMYIVSIPFILTGMCDGVHRLVVSVRNRKIDCYVPVLIWFLCVFLTAMFIGVGGPSIYRVNSVFMSYLIFAVDGLVLAFNLFRRNMKKFAKVFCGILAMTYMVSFVSFGIYYFTKYTEDTYMIDLFDFKFDEVIDFMENELPEGVSDRCTYYGEGNQTYIYYLGSTKTSPYDYNKLEDDTPYTLWLWTQSYKNFRFYYPDKIDPVGNYIVPEVSLESVRYFEEYGFKKEHIGTHYLFWNDMLDNQESNTEAVISWDHGINEGKIVTDGEQSDVIISGWAIDKTYGKIWDTVVLKTDNDCFTADIMERADVADALGDEQFADCGFSISVPASIIENSEHIAIIFMNLKEKGCYVVDFK